MLKLWVNRVGNHAEVHCYEPQPFRVLVIVLGMTVETAIARAKEWATERGYEVEEILELMRITSE